jgi:hypothetical protein
MFGFLKTLFSTPKAIGTGLELIEKGATGIGKLVFTEQEKAELSQKTFETWLDVQKVIGSESSIRSITRRILAVLIMGTFLSFLVGSAIAWPFIPAWSAFLLGLAKELSNLVLAVAIFYFGYYGVKQIAGK